MVASGLQVDVLRDCDRIQQIENSIKSRNDSGVESGETNGNGRMRMPRKTLKG